MHLLGKDESGRVPNYRIEGSYICIESRYSVLGCTMNISIYDGAR